MIYLNIKKIFTDTHLIKSSIDLLVYLKIRPRGEAPGGSIQASSLHCDFTLLPQLNPPLPVSHCTDPSHFLIWRRRIKAQYSTPQIRLLDVCFTFNQEIVQSLPYSPIVCYLLTPTKNHKTFLVSLTSQRQIINDSQKKKNYTSHITVVILILGRSLSRQHIFWCRIVCDVRINHSDITKSVCGGS